MRVTTFEDLNERDTEWLAAAGSEYGVDVQRRVEPAGDETAVLIEHRTLAPEDVARMPLLQTVFIFDFGKATLPVNHLDAKGILVRQVPNLAGLGVAEHAFALLLALKKQLFAGHQAVVQNVWRDGVTEPLYTDQRAHTFNWSGIPDLGWLYGETLGIIGFGRIGRAVAARARAFGMDVLYFNRHRLAVPVERQLGVRYAALPDLLAAADAVTLHLPFTPDSEHLLGAAEFALMKPTAILLNLARGRVVDEPALIEALQHRTIAAAGLDVLVHEPPHPDNPILHLDNVILTPHYAGIHSPVARREQFRTALRWIARDMD